MPDCSAGQSQLGVLMILLAGSADAINATQAVSGSLLLSVTESFLLCSCPSCAENCWMVDPAQNTNFEQQRIYSFSVTVIYFFTPLRGCVKKLQQNTDIQTCNTDSQTCNTDIKCSDAAIRPTWLLQDRLVKLTHLGQCELYKSTVF